MANAYQQAVEAWEEQDLPRVFDNVNTALQENGADARLIGILAGALEKSGLWAQAGEAYETAAEHAGQGAFPHYRAAMLAYDRAGLTDKAFIAAMRAQKLEPDDIDVIYVMARELALRGETRMLSFFKNRLTASDDPKHLELARDLIGHDNRNPFNLVLFGKLAKLTPDNPFIRFKLMSVAREFCDYDTIEAEERWMRAELAAGNESIFEGETPYSNLLHCADPRLNRLATNNRAIPVPPPAGLTERRRALPHNWTGKTRIGYLSGDFASTHATMRLLRHVLELHDRERFDVTLYDYTPAGLIAGDDGGRTGWGNIVPIHALSDAEAAARIRADGIDILVDLKGHTGGSRAQILNHMAAPVQVAWLGFPGSTVNVDLDYVIGDRFVLPDEDMAHYHEKACRLPASYQPNDPHHRPLPPAASRASLGLPEDQFVFASFNAARKITPQTLDLWAEILRRTERSLLWILIDGEQARQNFLKGIEARGVAADRVLFAANADYPDHIARLHAADLGLDTFPYNGHTTTSDMLWAGLPVLTKRGSNFASRVSESLLDACGLPWLVAGSDGAFVDMAIALAGGDGRIADARHVLADRRGALTLFASSTFCRDLEQAYQIMRDRAKKRMPPENIDLY